MPRRRSNPMPIRSPGRRLRPAVTVLGDRPHLRDQRLSHAARRRFPEQAHLRHRVRKKGGTHVGMGQSGALLDPIGNADGDPICVLHRGRHLQSSDIIGGLDGVGGRAEYLLGEGQRTRIGTAEVAAVGVPMATSLAIDGPPTPTTGARLAEHVRQEQDLIAIRAGVEPFADDDHGTWLAEGIGDATDYGADRVGGDGHDDDFGAVERGRHLRVVEGGDPRRNRDAEPWMWVTAMQRRDDSRVALGAPEAELMTAGMERGEQRGAHVARRGSSHASCPPHLIILLRIDPDPVWYYSRRK